MDFRINSITPFDRKFFGKSVRAIKNLNIKDSLTSKKLELDSIDDFNKHFQQKIFNARKGDTVVNDTFDIEALSTKPSIF